MDARAALVKVLREEGPRVLATLVRQLGDLSVAGSADRQAVMEWAGRGGVAPPRGCGGTGGGSRGVGGGLAPPAHAVVRP